eukprot:1144415-Pelagomonas_calceolata.AAC.1
MQAKGRVHKGKAPLLVGSDVYKPSKDTTQSSQHLELYIKPNEHGSTNTINRVELAGILVAPQQGHTDVASDNTTGFALPDARDPFHNFYWLTLKTSHGRNGDPHHSHTTPTHYLTNLTDKLRTHMQNRHKLGSADTSGYYHNSWQ